MPKKLTEQGSQRRAQLLDCAAELFSTRGYDQTRVIDICEAAGVAKGLFYWYFENKDALFSQLVTSMRQDLRRAQGTAIDPRADPITRLRQGIRASLEFMAEHGNYFRFLDVEISDARVRALLRDGNEVYVTDAARIIRAGIDAGLIVDEDPMVLAFGVVSGVNSFGAAHRAGRLDLDLEGVIKVTGDWVERAVSPIPIRASAP